jgi:metal-responsive CopG/Arc/MetJ family transcriptional regulator
MKCHISATLEESVLQELDHYRLEEKRSRSQVLEMAVEAFLKSRQHSGSLIISEGSFSGKFSREETYGDR